MRDFCVIRWCFVVLVDQFATEIPRAWLSKNQRLPNIKISNFLLPSSFEPAALRKDLQLNYAQEPELSILDNAFISCRQCHALCPSGRDQEAVRRIAVRIAREQSTLCRRGCI